MADARFDIGAAAPFQSRDGGLTKGGLHKNGFVEKSPDGVWSWQRPALATSMAAPVVGSGLGLIPYGSSLYGVISNGTATTYLYARGTTTSTNQFILGGGTGIDGTSTYIGFDLVGLGGFGSVTPSTVSGRLVNFLYYFNNKTFFSFGTSVALSTGLSSLQLGTVTLSTSSGTFVGTSFYSTYTAGYWYWGGSFVAGGTSTGSLGVTF